MFDINEYFNGLGSDLVNAFEKASNNSHPQAIGSGREKSVKDQLERILPNGVGVGSGFVIDSYGNISKQCDIIIYEKEFSLKFAPNDDEAYTYYNCENVIAVGQVKSSASAVEIRDAIDNLKSVKGLRRVEDYDNSFGQRLSSYRPYLTNATFAPTSEDQYNPQINIYDNIYTFLICKNFRTTSQTILSEIENICHLNRREYPNVLLSVDNNYCFWINQQQEQCYLANPFSANRFTMQNVDCSLGNLILELMEFIRKGRSVTNNKMSYFPNYQRVKLQNPLINLSDNE